MMARACYSSVVLVWLFAWCLVEAQATDGGQIYFPLLMPGVQPLTPESYLCTAFKMPSHEHQFIVEYLPNATKETAHHILIFGCEAPAYVERDTPHAVWDCGEMAGNGEERIFPKAGTCAGDTDIVYSWAMDAPSLKLPNGVGFKVGQGSKIKYLVLQVHYAHVHRFLRGDVDHSGITLRMLPQNNNEINKLAGVKLLVTGGRILPKSTEHYEADCEHTEQVEFHPFAFRTHTHKFGQVVSGYRIDGTTGQWQLIGKGDPQKPQMFYKTNATLTIKPGDKLAARCTMHNFLDKTVWVGPTGDDEMCNFYIMYYVNRMDHTLEEGYCYNSGPPFHYWNETLKVPHEIHMEASKMLK